VRAGAPQAALDSYVITSPAIRGKSTGKPPTEHIDQRKVIGLFERGFTLVIKDAAAEIVCNRLHARVSANSAAPHP